MEIMILHHESEDIGILLHKAIVTVKEWDFNEIKLTETISMLVGYHPLGYGCYPVSIERIDKNEYIVFWKTGTNCD